MHAGDHAAAAEPPHPERARLDGPVGVAGDDDPVEAVRAGVADVLDPEGVLVGEEVGEMVGDRAAAEQIGRGDGAVLDCGVPVLDPQPVSEDGVVDVRDVAGGEDPGRRGAQARVDQDPVVDRESGGGREVGLWRDPDADDQAVDGERVTPGQPDRRAFRA